MEACLTGGIVALIHPESHLHRREGRAAPRADYLRLRRHWQFVNELMLFEIEIKRDTAFMCMGIRLEPYIS